MKDKKALSEAVLSKLRDIAMTDATELVQVSDGQLVLKDTHALDPAHRAAIASVEKSAGGIRVKFYDRLKALELLGKHLGLFEGSEPVSDQSSTLLQDIINSTREVIASHDLPEIQQAAAACHDLVEQAGSEAL